MILIDSSALIEFFRKNGKLEVRNEVASIINDGRGAYTCPVRYELFSGARKHESDFLKAAFSFMIRLELNSNHWDTAAEIMAFLKSKGITVPNSDLLIATVAHQENIPILTCDIHYRMIKESAFPGLRLLLR